MGSPLEIMPEELARATATNPTLALQAKALLSIRQALFDILGAFPQDNVVPYFYAFSSTTLKGNALTAGGAQQQSIKISADAAFVAQSVRGSSDGDYLIQMRIDSSDRQLMNEPIINSAFVGTAQRPGPLHKPLLMPANTTASFDLTDISAAVNNIYFVLAGFKVYNRKIN